MGRRNERGVGLGMGRMNWNIMEETVSINLQGGGRGTGKLHYTEDDGNYRGCDVHVGAGDMEDGLMFNPNVAPAGR